MKDYTIIYIYIPILYKNITNQKLQFIKKYLFKRSLTSQKDRQTNINKYRVTMHFIIQIFYNYEQKLCIYLY